jgi:LPS sulfotransferase NodH
MKKALRKLIPLKIRLQLHQIRKYFWLLNKRKLSDKNFIIFGSGRSGSTLLTSLLNSHPQIYCDGEVLAKRNVPRVFFPFMYLEALSRKASDKNAEIYGCGLMSTQLRGQKNINAISFIKKLEKNKRKIIHIRRKYIFDVVLSLLEAKLHKVWFVHKGENKNFDKLKLNPSEVIYLIKHHIELYEIEDCALAGTKHFKIIYETDLQDNSNHPRITAQLFEFLSARPHAPKTNLSKKAKGKYKDRITNFDEIHNAITANGYSFCLNPEYL